ncbi:unnamed protein product [Sphagnum troendelagicum]
MHSGTVSALVDANLLYQQLKKLRLPRRSQVNSLISSFAQFSFFNFRRQCSSVVAVATYVNLFVTLRESAAAELAPGAVVVRIQEYVRLQWRVCSCSAKGNGAATLGYYYDDVVRRLQD